MKMLMQHLTQTALTSKESVDQLLEKIELAEKYTDLHEQINDLPGVVKKGKFNSSNVSAFVGSINKSIF